MPLRDSKHRTSQSPTEQPWSSASTHVLHRETACIPDVSLTRTWPIVLPPCNEASAVASKYIRKIQWTNTLNYNLAWTYGFFMFDIPQRLNINEALDSAVIALNCAHDDYCTRSQLSRSTLSIKTLGSYSRALASLRNCLDDPAKATSSETLCAVMILLICQVRRILPNKEVYSNLLNANGIVSNTRISMDRRGCDGQATAKAPQRC